MDLFGRFKKLDSSLQRGLDNSFARVFGGEVVPTEIDELLKQQAEESVMIDSRGQRLAPSYFRVLVSDRDYSSLTENRPRLTDEFVDRLSRFIRNQGWHSNGPIQVDVEPHEDLHSGQLRVDARFNAPKDKKKADATAGTGEGDSAVADGRDAPSPQERERLGGTPDGSYPDSYPGQRMEVAESRPEWPQREASQRSLVSQDYDVSKDGGRIVPEESGRSDSNPSAASGTAAGGAPSAGAAGAAAAGAAGVAGAAAAGAASNAGSAASTSGSTHDSSSSSAATSAPGSPRATAGASGLADLIRSDRAFEEDEPRRAASSDAQEPSHHQASAQSAAEHYPQEPSPNSGAADIPEPPVSYPGTEVIAQSIPDEPIRGGSGEPTGDSAMTVTLKLRDGSDRSYQLQQGSNLIGRGNGVDLRIPDTGVSRQHADIAWDGFDAVLTDLQSTNGTTVNDIPIENWLLADGDIIALGHSEIEVHFH